jgi:hypothetical protein
VLRHQHNHYIGKRDPETTIRLARDYWRNDTDVSDHLEDIGARSRLWPELEYVYYVLTEACATSEEQLREELPTLAEFRIAQSNSGLALGLSSDPDTPTIGEVLDFLIADDGLANGHATSSGTREALREGS